MNCKALTEELEKEYPPMLAEPWDNCGLLAGRWEKEVKSVYVALDPTKEVIAHAIEQKADMLLTHHPLMLQPQKKIHTGDFYGERLISLIRHDIVCYAMHTNYDVVRMADLAAEMLGLEETQVLEQTCELPDGNAAGFGKVGMLGHTMTLKECAEYVKRVFELSDVRVFGDPGAQVCRAAVLPGSGKSMVDAAIARHADVLISGDFGHHDGIDAVDRGLFVIDAGHYGIEHIFIEQMKEELHRRFPELTVYAEPVCHPFFAV